MEIVKRVLAAAAGALLAITLLTLPKEAASAPPQMDFYMKVFERGHDTDAVLAIKRFISLRDCRRERVWVLDLLDAMKQDTRVWITCTRGDDG